jgi:LPXTG-motif cell wall-anchored protein
MIRRSLIVLILVVSAFQLLGIMRLPSIAAAAPTGPLALTETAEPPTPIPPTAVPPTAVPPTAVPPTAVPPTNTPVPPPPDEPDDTPTPVPPAEGTTPSPIAGTEVVGSPTPTPEPGAPTPTPTPIPGTPPTPKGLPKTGDSPISPLLWLGIALLIVAIGGFVRSRRA